MDNVGSYKDSAKSINHWRDYWDSKKLEYPYPDDLNDPFNFDSCKKGYCEVNLDRFRVIDTNSAKDKFIGWNGSTLKESLEYILDGAIWKAVGDDDEPKIVIDYTPSIKDLEQLKDSLVADDPCGTFDKIIRDIDLAISSSEVCSVFNSRFGYSDLDMANNLSDFRTRILIVKN
ncbi:hypothetical protein LMG7974_00700 [Campylobacter majalis]|uniref:Uncharacterized protein n=1 Tax=Campylobacter majalis TaxID=2790656 RepID=A0ABN7KAM1_9BACT|nr:hypothetical protein [Campylobacter majalis]CAD7287812.1 hypothetical protein LMG7974_00700 [Campylobacter majalis]